MKWAATFVETPYGRQSAIAPIVISASRATDIPAFYAEWFMNRLDAGYCVWENPFNAKQRQYISFERCRSFVFWSKNPATLLPYLPQVVERGYQFYFQYTLNDYDKFFLEPNLPKLEKRIELFKCLSDNIGRHRVIWRFDPIILGGGLTVENTLDRLYAIGREIAPYTEKLVFSFVNWYKKTERELGKIDKRFHTPSNEEMMRLASGIVEVERALPNRLELATCAETLSLDALGIKHNKCVDPDLLLRLCPDCTEFQEASGKSARRANQGSLLKLPSLSQIQVTAKSAKDSGQRKPCGCAPSKDIGTYNTCLHFCAYCYANQSQNAVRSKLQTVNQYGEKL